MKQYAASLLGTTLLGTKEEPVGSNTDHTVVVFPAQTLAAARKQAFAMARNAYPHHEKHGISVVEVPRG